MNFDASYLNVHRSCSCHDHWMHCLCVPPPANVQTSCREIPNGPIVLSCRNLRDSRDVCSGLRALPCGSLSAFPLFPVLTNVEGDRTSQRCLSNREALTLAILGAMAAVPLIVIWNVLGEVAGLHWKISLGRALSGVTEEVPVARPNLASLLDGRFNARLQQEQGL